MFRPCYWGEEPDDGKRWSFVGTIQGTVETAEDDATETTSVSVTLMFDTKTGSIKLTVEVNLDWDNFSMDLVMQGTTRAMCDEIKGSYIRGDFNITLENSTNSSSAK